MLRRLYKWWTGEEMHRHEWGLWAMTDPPTHQIRRCETCGLVRYRQIPTEW